MNYLLMYYSDYIIGFGMIRLGFWRGFIRIGLMGLCCNSLLFGVYASAGSLGKCRRCLLGRMGIIISSIYSNYFAQFNKLYFFYFKSSFIFIIIQMFKKFLIRYVYNQNLYAYLWRTVVIMILKEIRKLYVALQLNSY